MVNPKRWLIGYAGTWVVLVLMSDSSQFAELAAALAVSIAIGATFILGPDAAHNLGITIGG